MHCRCLSEGVANPPPCPVVFTDDYVSPAPGYEELDDEVEAWAEHACAHRQLRLVAGQVFTGPLRGAMADHGGEQAYPALAASLPRNNWGSVPPDQARVCLEELQRLSEMMRDQPMVVIVDLVAATVLHVLRENSRLIGWPLRYIPRPGMTQADGQWRVHGLTTPPGVQTTMVWLDADGVIRVRDTEHGRTLFAATELVQYAAGDRWIFHDVHSGTELCHDSPIRWHDNALVRLPERLRAETQSMDIDLYLYGVAHLRALFTAAVQTGNPVCWY